MSTTATATEWVTLAMQALCLVTLGWMLVDPPARQVMLAVPHTVYGLPACPTEDSGLPGGCVFDGGDRGTWVIYTPGRA